jgi:hypothetical protein
MRTHKRAPNLDRLIAIEWNILDDLRKMLGNPELSTGEKTRLANALAYHASVLNKLLSQEGEASQFDDATLGDFIKDVDARTFRLVRRDFRLWTRRLSLKR